MEALAHLPVWDMLLGTVPLWARGLVVITPLRKMKAMHWSSFFFFLLFLTTAGKHWYNLGSLTCPRVSQPSCKRKLKNPSDPNSSALQDKCLALEACEESAFACVCHSIVQVQTDVEYLLLQNPGFLFDRIRYYFSDAIGDVFALHLSHRGAAKSRAQNTNGSNLICVLYLLLAGPSWCMSWLFALKEIRVEVTVPQVIWGRLWNAKKTSLVCSGQMGLWMEKNESSERIVRPFCLSFYDSFGSWKVQVPLKFLQRMGSLFPCLWKGVEGAQGRSSLPSKARLWREVHKQTGMVLFQVFIALCKVFELQARGYVGSKLEGRGSRA